jgi:UDP-N-acetylmuramate--alanine ligase
LILLTAMMNHRKIHFIGIGGIGMCGLAEYFIGHGYIVSGSDIAASHITARLESLGAEIYTGHNAENISSDVNTVVYTSAVKSDNPEYAKAKELGIRTIKRAEMLGEIVNDRFLIAVAGTHGKTTTTAMIGKLLADAGLDPVVFVGGNTPLFNGSTYRPGKGNYAVVEADEYDRSFLTLKPDIAVITNVDEDHLDIYKDLNDIKQTFAKFCSLAKPAGKIIYYGDDNNINDFINKTEKEKISYGFGEKSFLKIKGFMVEGGKITFSIMNSVSAYNDISLSMVGRHNVLNSAACFGVAKTLGISFNDFKKSIAGFKTVDRRLQLKYDNGDITVYDDYAHHPREIASSLSGLKEFYGKSRLVTVFQPHLYTRTRDLYKDFAKELSAADEVILLDIYPAREKPIKGITSELIYKELKNNGVRSVYITDKTKVTDQLMQIGGKGNIIVFQGAGDITLICDEFVNVLKAKK